MVSLLCSLKSQKVVILSVRDIFTMDKSEIIAELVASKQQEDTLENELLARTRENTLLKQRL